MVCGNTRSGKFIVACLVLGLGITLILLYLAFLIFGGNIEPSSRLTISRYDSDSNEFRVGKDLEEIEKIKSNIEDFLKPYDLKNPKVSPYYCDFIVDQPDDKACAVKLENFGPCTAEKVFGLYDRTPCIFLKYKSDSKFKPEFYETIEDIPEDMPEYLRNSTFKDIKEKKKTSKTLWVSCEGKSLEDKKYLGPVRTFVGNGFYGYYFQCKKDELCTDPLVAIQFQRLEKKNVEINIVCRVWAKNAADSVEFKLFVEE